MDDLATLFRSWTMYCRLYDDADTPTLRARYGRLIVDFAMLIRRRIGL